MFHSYFDLSQYVFFLIFKVLADIHKDNHDFPKRNIETSDWGFAN